MTEPSFAGRFAGAIDCDVHSIVPTTVALAKYLPAYWKSFNADADNPSLEPNSYPPGHPFTFRPGSRPEPVDNAGDALTRLRRHVFEELGASVAIVNCLHGAPLVRNDAWGAVMATAANDWVVDNWLDPEPRLRASILIPWQNPERAVAEIEKRAGDRRFVQILMYVRSEQLLGRPFYWPVYEAAQRHNLPIAIHAGGGMGHPTTPVGWTRYYAEDYLNVAQSAQAQLTSLVVEGVFSKFHGLKVVFSETGFSWLPSLMWRLDKNWKGLRREVPWLDQRPSDYIKQHTAFTMQPDDADTNPAFMLDIIEQIGSDEMLLFASDYPHWHYDEEGPLAFELPAELERKILTDNATRTYTL